MCIYWLVLDPHKYYYIGLLCAQVILQHINRIFRDQHCYIIRYGIPAPYVPKGNSLCLACQSTWPLGTQALLSRSDKAY